MHNRNTVTGSGNPGTIQLRGELPLHGLPPFLTEKQLAGLLNISPRTLQAQRRKGVGFPFIRIGTAIRYNWAQVEACLAGQTHLSTSDDAA